MCCHQLLLTAVHVLVGAVPRSCVARYVCAGWCDATSCAARYVCAGGSGFTPLSWPLCMSWFVWCHPFVLSAMCVLVGVVPPPFAARYVCAGGCGVTPLFGTLCECCMVWCPPGKCRLVWCYPLVLPAMYVLFGVEAPPCVAGMYVLVGVVPPTSVTRYVCAGWCGATRLCSPLRMCWMLWCHTLPLSSEYVLLGQEPLPCVACYVCAY